MPMNRYSKIDQSEITSLLFPPQCDDCKSLNCPSSAEDVVFEIDPGISLTCRYYFSAQDAPVLILYPATDGFISLVFDDVAAGYIKHGINVFIVSYRGCGINNGSPSVGAMYADSKKLFDSAIKWLGGKACNGPIFVFGQSLGSICAIDTVLTNTGTVKGLILESSICGTSSFLKALGVNAELAEISEEEGFNTLEKIEKIKNPTLIFHGARDRMVSSAEAEKIQASSGARTKQFYVIPGAEHHNVGETGGDLYIKTIKQFMDTVCGVNTWRQRRKNLKSNHQG